MKVKCLHGYFIFSETRPGQISDFSSLTGLVVEAIPEGFTFAPLIDLPDYSLPGKTLLNLPASAVFEGRPWDVLEANGLTYDLMMGVLAPIATVTNQVRIDPAGEYFITSGLIQPGSIDQNGKRIKNYSGFYSRDTGRWLYSEVEHV